MSGFAIVGIILGGVIASVVLSLVITEFLICSDISGFWPYDIYCWVRDKKKVSPKERQPEVGTIQPEVGTIRIVEKMDEDGGVYYIALIANRSRKGPPPKVWWCALLDGEKFDTVEETQEAANAEIDRRNAKQDAERVSKERAAHHKVMGEFKP